MKRRILVVAALALLCGRFAGAAEEIPAEYRQVLGALGKSGDYKDHVLKINLPRNDLHVTVAGQGVPGALGFGGWIAMTAADDGSQVLMGDLVLTEAEVNPLMSVLLQHGIEVTALHNHFFYEQPRIFYMHVHGHGNAMQLARNIKPALDMLPTAAASPSQASGLNVGRIAHIVGQAGEDGKGVYKVTVGRSDLTVRDMGAVINARMGLNTWAAFAGTDADAVVAGDVAMLAAEVPSVLRALRAHGLSVVAIHQHMTESQPMIIFLHYWGKGPADKLADGFRAALDQLGHGK